VSPMTDANTHQPKIELLLQRLIAADVDQQATFQIDSQQQQPQPTTPVVVVANPEQIDIDLDDDDDDDDMDDDDVEKNPVVVSNNEEINLDDEMSD
jgi:hypothetical protein